MIAYSALRMAVKNRIIVDVLRDRLDFDPERLARLARTHLEALAEQEHATAVRLEHARDDGREDRRQLAGETPDPLRAEKERRGHIIRLLAESLDRDLTDDEAIHGIVDSARLAAWDEIQGSLTRHARAVAPVDREPGYEDERLERIGAFVALDLTELAHERGLALER